MQLPDKIAPYASLLKWALIVGLLVAVRVEGCMTGKAKNAETVLTLQARVDSLNKSLSEFVGLYDRTTAQTKANAAAAKEIQDSGIELARRALIERKEAQAEATKLEKALQAERTGCVDGERKVCGIPLR